MKSSIDRNRVCLSRLDILREKVKRKIARLALPETEARPPIRGTVSVLIPCWNKAPWIRETVMSALHQRRKPDAIHALLMDEDSIAMKEELEGLSPIVRCSVSERKSITASRNWLAERCETDFLTFLDADDLLPSTFFRRMLSKEADFIFPCYKVFEDGVQSKGKEHFIFGNLTGVYRTSSFRALGMLSPDFEKFGNEDSDFIYTVLESGCSFREEQGTYYLLRRDWEDERWVSSSIVCTDLYKSHRAEVVDKLIEKHAKFFDEAFFLESA